MARLRCAPTLGIGCALLLSTGRLPLLAQTPPPIKFEVPAVVDPIHTNGEPDIGIDPFGRVFVSGPTGTGTQRSVWLGSVDRGHTFRIISPGPPPSAIAGIIDPPVAVTPTSTSTAAVSSTLLTCTRWRAYARPRPPMVALPSARKFTRRVALVCRVPIGNSWRCTTQRPARRTSRPTPDPSR